jgi:hypothetical protein
MLVRAPVTGWLERPRPWALVATAGSALMTLFLWHLTALVLAVLVLHPLGLTEPAPGTPVWWALRPLWVLVPAALLVPLVGLFARFERPRPSVHRRPGRCRLAGVGGATAGGTTAATALGIAAAILGLLGIAVGGIWPLPGTAGDLVGIRIGPGVGLLLLGGGVVVLGAVGSRGE